ncbi:unnamed protein product [Heterobilharzia americana]|nr:unnamed protein product [Heterobilharzia americana]
MNNISQTEVIDNINNHTCIDHFPWLEVFHQNYQRIHVYLCLILCPVGVIANTLNVVVLCQPRLRSPTNLLLTVLAVSDGFVMFIYIIFDYFYLMTPRLTDGMTKAYAQLLLVNIVLQNLFHAFSAWIIVAVAIFRLIYIKAGVRAAIYCNTVKAWIAVLLVLVSSILLTIPFMIAHQVRVKPSERLMSVTQSSMDRTDSNTMSKQLKSIEVYEVDYTTNISLRVILFWNSAILVKALPIIIMTTVSAALISSIRESEKRYRILRRYRNCKDFQATLETTRVESLLNNANENSNPTNQHRNKSNSHHESYSGGRSANQTTYMLLTIIILYIVTYLPQSALLLLNNFQGGCFSATVYERLGDFLDFLTLINNGLNFILYCVMSRQFRYTFLQLFCPF